MAYNKTIWVNDNLPAINAENLNNIENGVESAKNVTDNILQIGDVYFTSTSDNPSERLGGTWELVRSFYGGELVAYSTTYNSANNTQIWNSNIDYSFFEIGNMESKIINYFDDIIAIYNGSIYIKTKDIVGVVEVQVYISGRNYEANDLQSIWFVGNKYKMPTGVMILPTDGQGTMGTMNNDGYGGANTTLLYSVSEESTENTEFSIDPLFRVYGGQAYIGNAGTKCCLIVKAYAKGGTNYMWKKVA